jgi:GAF domain-containing protein
VYSASRPSDLPVSTASGPDSSTQAAALDQAADSTSSIAALQQHVERLLAGGTEIAQVLNYLAERIVGLFQADGAAIALQQAETVRCVGSAGATAPEIGTELNVTSGISGVCFRSGVSQYCFDARGDERVDAATCEILGVRSILVVPVLVADRSVGLVEVFSVEDFFFNQKDIEQLASVAALVGTLFERCFGAPSESAEQSRTERRE